MEFDKYKLQRNSFYIDGTDIPTNKLKIEESAVLHQLEKEFLEESYTIIYNELNDSTLFNENYLKELHRRTFCKLYEWAGKYRNTDMAKGESRFCQGMFLDSSAKKIFNELEADKYLKNYTLVPKERFAKKLAYYKCELIALHPFPELNGRVTRMFFDMIAIINGYDLIDYSGISSEKYIEASIECVQFADCSAFEKIIFDGLKNREER